MTDDDQMRSNKHICQSDNTPASEHTHTKYLSTKSKNAASDNPSDDVDRDLTECSDTKQSKHPLDTRYYSLYSPLLHPFTIIHGRLG